MDLDELAKHLGIKVSEPNNFVDEMSLFLGNMYYC